MDSFIRRSWAGHSFDIVSKARHEKEYPRIPVGDLVVRLNNGKWMKPETSQQMVEGGLVAPWEDVTDMIHLR